MFEWLNEQNDIINLEQRNVEIVLNQDKKIQWVCFIYTVRNEQWKWSSNLAKQMLKWKCVSQMNGQSKRDQPL